MELKPLKIGDIEVKYPIVQGGMGIGISLSTLAAAVTKEGGIGVISAAQPGFMEEDFYTNTNEANMRALSYHIKKAKELSGGGVIGVNLMVASKQYDMYVDCIIKSGADLIISGAGLPLDLPKYAAGSDIKLCPIVSSAKAANVILTRWMKKYKRLPDMIVIEGPKAGGHLGFKPAELETITSMDEEIGKILAVRDRFSEQYSKTMPVIFGGGVFDRSDIDHYLSLGLNGVQMATRFVATEECDASPAFKQAYINAKKGDARIVKSPVGMPGRAINNIFVQNMESGNGPKVTRCFNCLNHCDPRTTPYCISLALFNAAKGDLDNGLIFCGENVDRVNKMTTVHEIFEELTKEG
ncbi:MAG: nitronate monooxygenase family protein [Clostridiales bacterium]|nr:nitronate monooxygenase family protein [Clostridiales bacterium]